LGLYAVTEFCANRKSDLARDFHGLKSLSR
jgi:hypothetical protein